MQGLGNAFKYHPDVSFYYRAITCATELQVFMLPSDAVLEESTLGKIISSGHSRVPIHHPDNRSAHQSSRLTLPALPIPKVVSLHVRYMQWLFVVSVAQVHTTFFQFP